MIFSLQRAAYFKLGLRLVCALITIFNVACSVTPPAPPIPPTALTVQTPPGAAVLERASFNAIPGWNEDDLTAAWPAFLASCNALKSKRDWQSVCLRARQISVSDSQSLREFFEKYFSVYQIRNAQGRDTGLITGYYEPLLRGSRVAQKPYLTPLYAVPDDLLVIDLTAVYPDLKDRRLRGRLLGKKVLPYPSRALIEHDPALRGKELVWVDDPLAAFFLQIQGSGRVQLFDGDRSGEVIRLAYAEQNGHPYQSIGRWLVEQGQMTLEQASMQSIQAWAQAHPERVDELLNVNPSYVFFSEEKIIDPAIGPKGALGVPLTPGRSIAIDPQAIPLGAPVFLVTTWPNRSEPLRRLMIAQDTGGAIRGAPRADFFWGFGDEAGKQAGRMKQTGQMWVLLPIGQM